ncbi:MAG: hypothetical protein ACI3XO_01230 [Eubacteriales bacterium]
MPENKKPPAADIVSFGRGRKTCLPQQISLVISYRAMRRSQGVVDSITRGALTTPFIRGYYITLSGEIQGF